MEPNGKKERKRTEGEKDKKKTRKKNTNRISRVYITQKKTKLICGDRTRYIYIKFKCI